MNSDNQAKPQLKVCKKKQRIKKKIGEWDKRKTQRRGEEIRRKERNQIKISCFGGRKI